MSKKSEKTETQDGQRLAPAAWLGCWTLTAIQAGGILTLKRNGWNYEATMMWPATDIGPISSAESEPLRALNELEKELNEDAANEMIDNEAA